MLRCVLLHCAPLAKLFCVAHHPVHLQATGSLSKLKNAAQEKLKALKDHRHRSFSFMLLAVDDFKSNNEN
jgi:hypothetical protein